MSRSKGRLVFAHYLFTAMMYGIGAVALGIALLPSVLCVWYFWQHSTDLLIGLRLLALSVLLMFGYFLFGVVLIFVAGLTRRLLRLNISEGVHPIGSITMLKWMMSSALIIAVRFFFMDFMLLTPLTPVFFKIMGAKVGDNVQINSARVGDLSLLEIGDNAVIGGGATVICHLFEKEGLKVRRVRIGNNVIVGLNAVVMPGAELGDGSVIAAGALVTKDMKIAPGSVHYGVEHHHPDPV